MRKQKLGFDFLNFSNSGAIEVILNFSCNFRRFHNVERWYRILETLSLLLLKFWYRYLYVMMYWLIWFNCFPWLWGVLILLFAVIMDCLRCLGSGSIRHYYSCRILFRFGWLGSIIRSFGRGVGCGARPFGLGLARRLPFATSSPTLTIII